MRKQKAKKPKCCDIKVVAASFLAVFATALIGSLFTDTTGWYESIKPAITPPNFVFPIVWTILFILIGFSIYLSWTNADKNKKKSLAVLFGINLILNILWSVFFFGMKNPSLSFADIILFWFSIIFLIKATWKISRLSAWLLLPYALWVSFAALLNYLIAFA
jgi:benzodiazapine receptor